MTKKRDKITLIETEQVVVPMRKLTATWTVEDMSDITPYKKSKKKKNLTRDEEADLIIQRLQKTDKELQEESMVLVEQELIEELSKAIQDEIDAELVKSFVDMYTSTVKQDLK